MNSSIFSFLKKDDLFNDAYTECIVLEKEIKHECYTASLRTARVISELLIKILAKNNKKIKKELFYIRDDGNENIPKLVQMIEACKTKKEIDYDTGQKYHEIRLKGNPCAHGENIDEFNINDSKNAHKLVFDIALNCFNHFNQIKLEYKYDLSYLKDNDSITKEELELHESFIYENEISKDNFMEYIQNKGIFLPIKSFKEFIADYNDKIVKYDIFEDLMLSLDFITDDNLDLVLNNFEPSDVVNIKKEIKNYNQNRFNEVIDVVNEFEANQFTIADIELLINEEHNNEILNLFKLLSRDLINIHLKEIIDEMKSIPVITIEENDRTVVKATNYEILEDKDGFYIKHTEEKFELDSDQEKAVEYDGEKPLVINAGPGSGKTRVIVERVVYLVNKLQKDPSSILVITFTVKAAEELRNRLMNHPELNTHIVNQMRISTVHSFCRYLISINEPVPYNYLMRNGERNLFLLHHKGELGFVYDSFIYDYQISGISRTYDEYFNFGVYSEELLEYMEDKYKIRKVYHDFIDEFYSENNINFLPPKKELYLRGVYNDWKYSGYINTARSFKRLEKLMEDNKCCDSNYLLKKANQILENKTILDNLQYTNILIDEFQDTDHNQMKIFEKLLQIRDTFTIVGDSDQSIYGWRGALPVYFNQYAENREKYEVVTLHNNYRSSRDIVEFNEAFIQDYRDIPKELNAVKKYKIPIFHLACTPETQYLNIVKLIKNLKRDNKVKYYGDIVVLFRLKRNIAEFIPYLEDEKIDYYLKDHNDLHEQDEIKAFLTLLWYLMPFNPYEYGYREDDYLNLYGFTDEKYKSSNIFKLSENTMKVLYNIQRNYERKIMREAFKVYQKLNDGATCYFKNLASVFHESDEFLEETFKNIEFFDLADLNREGLRKLGIIDEDDLDFFMKLNEIKSSIYDKNIKKYNKPTTLDIYFKLINLTDYFDEILLQNDKKSKKVKLNLALLSEIIYDFESIVGRYEYSRLFSYLNGIIRSYSCPINDFEDNTNKVHVMTIHGAKGLEYPVVILGSIKDGICPKSFRKPSIPVKYFEYRSNTIDDEKTKHKMEELRNIYVATTRAKELLVLSTISQKNQQLPRFLKDIVKKFDKIQTLAPHNLNIIPKIESSRNKTNINLIPKLVFEEIIRDFLFCPVKYDITNNINFKNRLIDRKFSEYVLHLALDNISNQNKSPPLDIDEIIDKMLLAFKITEENDVYYMLKNIELFWNEFGKHFDVLENNIPITLKMKYCDLNGLIDLIIKENDNQISLVQFISSDDELIKNERIYMLFLHYYGYVISQKDEYKKYTINKLIVHSFENNKQYEIKYNKKRENVVIKKLEAMTKDIVNENFIKKTKNCIDCEYSEIICKNE